MCGVIIPSTKVFEIYAEGGGNTFSLDIDSKGRVFTGTNGGNTRGWYFPQGSYSNKNWGKHGPLTNPYAFGFFPPMKFEGDGRRFPQAFCIYEGGLFPEEFDGTIVAPNALQNLIWNSPRFRDGSTYRTVDEAEPCRESRSLVSSRLRRCRSRRRGLRRRLVRHAAQSRQPDRRLAQRQRPRLSNRPEGPTGGVPRRRLARTFQR